MTDDSSAGSKDYGSNFAQLYDSLFADRKDYDAEVSALDNFFRSRGVVCPSRVLDFGCGTGTHAILFRNAGYDVTGIDQSADMVRHAKAKGSDVEFLVGNLTQLQDASFDVCYSLFNVINCFDTSRELSAVLHDMWRLLKPGGIVFIEAWNGIATLLDPPTPVSRAFQFEGRDLIRLAEPDNSALFMQRLTINYLIASEGYSSDKESSKEVRPHATHHLRLFTPFQIHELLLHAGFNDVETLSALPSLRDNAGPHDRMLAFVGVKHERSRF